MKLNNLNNNSNSNKQQLNEGLMDVISSLGKAAGNVLRIAKNTTISAAQVLGQVGLALLGDSHHDVSRQIQNSFSGNDDFNKMSEDEQSELVQGAAAALASGSLDARMSQQLTSGKLSNELIKRINKVTKIKKEYVKIYLDAGYDNASANAQATIDIGLKKSMEEVKRELEENGESEEAI